MYRDYDESLNEHEGSGISGQSAGEEMFNIRPLLYESAMGIHESATGTANMQSGYGHLEAPYHVQKSGGVVIIDDQIVIHEVRAERKV